MNEPLLLSIQNAAALLSISRSLLYEMEADGRLGVQVHKIGRRSLINRKDLEKWVNAKMPTRSAWMKMENHG